MVKKKKKRAGNEPISEVRFNQISQIFKEGLKKKQWNLSTSFYVLSLLY